MIRAYNAGAGAVVTKTIRLLMQRQSHLITWEIWETVLWSTVKKWSDIDWKKHGVKKKEIPEAVKAGSCSDRIRGPYHPEEVKSDC